MRICGVEIKGTEAVVSLLEYKDGLFTLPDCRVRKVEFDKKNRASDLQYFQATFKKLLEDYKIDKTIIKERPLKGKFAGGALGFKMEAGIQLIDSQEVKLLNNSEIKAIIKKNPIPIPFTETGLKIFQQGAFEAAYSEHMFIHYPIEAE